MLDTLNRPVKPLQIDLFMPIDADPQEFGTIATGIRATSHRLQELNSPQHPLPDLKLRTVADEDLYFGGTWRSNLSPDQDISTHSCADLIVVPDLNLNGNLCATTEYARTLGWLINSYYGARTSILSLGSGVLLLAASRLLDCSPASAPFAHLKDLRKLTVKTRLRPNQDICYCSADSRLITTGAGATWEDALFHLMSRYVGEDHAIKIAEHFTVTDPIGAKPAARRITTQLLAESHEIQLCQRWLERNYASNAPVTELARMTSKSQRSLTRIFRREIGLSPLDYVHVIRIEEAKSLLDSSCMSAQEIALRVGYQDAIYFSRVFQRNTGVSPRRYRRRLAWRDKARQTADPAIQALIRETGISPT